MSRNEALAKRLNTWVYILTVIILVAVVGMRYIELDLGVDFKFLPPIHAVLNSLTAVILIAAVQRVKSGDVLNHRRLMLSALCTSVLFLVSYLLYHTTTEPTLYGGKGAMRYVYFFLLITHVVLAAVSLPFILLTFVRGYTGLIEEHRRMARWVYPLWLYVAVTGPICYLMLMPYYG